MYTTQVWTPSADRVYPAISAWKAPPDLTTKSVQRGTTVGRLHSILTRVQMEHSQITPGCKERTSVYRALEDPIVRD